MYDLTITIMCKAEEIFTKAKAMLRDFKDDSVDGIDDKIDDVCDKIIILLRKWGEVFRTLYMKDPSQADMTLFQNNLDAAVEKHRELRGLVDFNNDTPKLHCIEDHAVEQLERHPDLLLMIEEWVEQFHQTEKKKVENRSTSMKDPFQRAEFNSKKRSAVNDPGLAGHSTKVQMASARGSYKKTRN